MSVGAETRPSYADAQRQLLQTRVLDAVGELLDDRRWNEVTMSQVADRAGVSRQTLYNSFGGRSELAGAYVLREAEQFIAIVEDQIRERRNHPRQALAAALEIFLAAVETHPLVKAISTSDSADELLALLTTRGAPVIGLVTDRLAALLTDTWAGLADRDAREIADALVRLAISHAALPSGSAAETADSVARLLGPRFEELLAEIDGAPNAPRA